jgi:hypothetical protein
MKVSITVSLTEIYRMISILTHLHEKDEVFEKRNDTASEESEGRESLLISCHLGVQLTMQSSLIVKLLVQSEIANLFIKVGNNGYIYCQLEEFDNYIDVLRQTQVALRPIAEP